MTQRICYLHRLPYPPRYNYYLSLLCLACFQIAQRIAFLVTQWLRVGYVQGNMNSDNTLLGGRTLDYGPYGWMERYDPMYQPFTSDSDGKFAFIRQPTAMSVNLAVLGTLRYVACTVAVHTDIFVGSNYSYSVHCLLSVVFTFVACMTSHRRNLSIPFTHRIISRSETAQTTFVPLVRESAFHHYPSDPSTKADEYIEQIKQISEKEFGTYFYKEFDEMRRRKVCRFVGLSVCLFFVFLVLHVAVHFCVVSRLYCCYPCSIPVIFTNYFSVYPW
jgi:uncharacterized protein YdiU (UPF0061 family)